VQAKSKEAIHELFKQTKLMKKAKGFEMIISEGGVERIPFVFFLFLSFEADFCE